MPIIEFERGNLRGKRFVLPAGGVIRIGRDQTCQIKLRDAMVSRVHCVLRGEKGVWTVEDAGSSNGTAINGAVLPKTVLVPGDMVRVGDSVFSFLATQDDPWVGKALGGYRLKARIGRGGMGTVYRAHQLSLEREVALKILATTLAKDPDFVSRFMQEARAAARLNHPNVVQIYDAGSDGNTYFIAMEHLPGGALEDVMIARGPIPYREAVPIACDALKALAFAQAHGIVHRDIKPGNLLFAHDGTVKVCDLGIALDLRRPGAGREMATAGSPAYMAPEQARGEALDHRADLYALGATLYHAIAGTPPIDGATVKEILNKKVTQEAPPLRERVPEVPPRLSQAVGKLLALSPANRFSTAQEAEEALNAAMSAPSPAPAAPRRSPAARSASYKKRAPVGPKAAAAAGVALLVFIGALLAVKHSSAPERATPAKEPPKRVEVVDPSKAVIAPDPLLAERERQRAEERELAKAEERAARAVEEHTALVERLLAAKDFRGAAAALDDFPASTAATAARAKLRAEFIAKVKTELTACGTRVAEMCDAARFDDARAEVEALRAKLPATEGAGIDELARSVVRAEERRAAALQDVALATRDVMRRAAVLDFAAASKALAEFVADRPGSEALYAPLKADLEGAEKIWQLLSKSIDAAVKARKPLALTFPSDRLGGPTEGRFRLTGLAHDRLSFEEIDGKRRKDMRSLFDLAPEALGALLGEPNLKAPLGLLCLLRAGPDSAMASLLANDLPAGVRAANERHLDALSGFWLDARHASLKRFREETAAAKNPPLEALGFSAREALTLLLAWKSAHTDIVAALKAWFLADRRQYLASGPLDSFFHAPTVKSPRAGFVHLVYDFATEDQVADFVTAVAAKPPGRTGARPEPAPEEKPAVRWLADKKAMQLTGEARFLREDPFEESIIVTGKVTGCFPESPNVNIAFFTSATDRVTIALGELDLEAWWRRRGQPMRPEYVVFGMGYYLPIELNNNPGGGGGQPSLLPRGAFGGALFAAGGGRGGIGGGRGGLPGGIPGGGGGGRGGAPGGIPPGGLDGFLRGLRNLGPIYIREPSLVIMGGEHGRNLGHCPEQLLWGQGAGGKIGAPLHYQIGVSKGAIQWAMRGKLVPYAKSPEIARLGDTLSPQGSFSLFTGESTVLYGGIEVQAKLRTEWVAKEADRRAQEDLARALSGNEAAGAPGGDRASRFVAPQP